MSITKAGQRIGAAAHADRQDFWESLHPVVTPDYASIVKATFGKEQTILIYMTGWEYFKQVSLWLSRLDDQERETASVMVGLGHDLDKVMQVIECDRMTMEVKETQASL